MTQAMIIARNELVCLCEQRWRERLCSETPLTRLQPWSPRCASAGCPRSMRTTGTERYRPVMREDVSMRQVSTDLIDANTYPNAIHEQPDEVEHDPEGPGDELRRQTREEHGHRDEQARAPETGPEAVLWDPDAPTPLPPCDDYLVGETACERRTDCNIGSPFVRRGQEEGNGEALLMLPRPAGRKKAPMIASFEMLYCFPCRFGFSMRSVRSVSARIMTYDGIREWYHEHEVSDERRRPRQRLCEHDQLLRCSEKEAEHLTMMRMFGLRSRAKLLNGFRKMGFLCSSVAPHLRIFSGSSVSGSQRYTGTNAKRPMMNNPHWP